MLFSDDDPLCQEHLNHVEDDAEETEERIQFGKVVQLEHVRVGNRADEPGADVTVGDQGCRDNASEEFPDCAEKHEVASGREGCYFGCSVSLLVFCLTRNFEGRRTDVSCVGGDFFVGVRHQAEERASAEFGAGRKDGTVTNEGALFDFDEIEFENTSVDFRRVDADEIRNEGFVAEFDQTGSEAKQVGDFNAVAAFCADHLQEVLDKDGGVHWVAEDQGVASQHVEEELAVVHQTVARVVTGFDVPRKNDPTKDDDPKVNPDKVDADDSREAEEEETESCVCSVNMDDLPNTDENGEEGKEHDTSKDDISPEVEDCEAEFTSSGWTSSTKTNICTIVINVFNKTTLLLIILFGF